jgi:hypothetical protein
VAHLTYPRIDISPEEKRWPHLEMAIALNGCFFEFISQAPKARLGELANLTRIIHQRLKRVGNCHARAKAAVKPSLAHSTDNPF